MKNINIFLAIITTISFNLKGQINIDSLKKELKKLIQIESSNKLKDYTIKYLNEDSLLVYEVSYDPKGEITGNWGDLAIYFYQYDEKGRCIESRFYDKNGKLCFADCPPIIRKKYDKRNNIIKIEYFGEDQKLIIREESDYDDFTRVIERRIFSNKPELDYITRFEYKDEGKIKLVRYYNAKNELESDSDGVAIFYLAYTSSNQDSIIEERFFDKNLKLVSLKLIDYNNPDYVEVFNETGEVKLNDGKAHDESVPLNEKQKVKTYSIKRYKYLYNKTIIEYFDMNDEKVEEYSD